MKKIRVVLLFILFVVGSLLIVNYYNRPKSKIDNILKTESYAYLSSNAKKFIKNIYNETNVIVLTEKNKEVNKPYLNPEFINYLDMDKSNREDVLVVPDTYVIDYITNNNDLDNSLPATYDLRNVNGRNYISPMKNQESMGICWAFSAVENSETLLMKENDLTYSDIPKFSVRHLDYVTSNDKLIKMYSDPSIRTICSSCEYTSWDNDTNGSRSLGGGGNYYVATIALSNGLSLVPETVVPWNTNLSPLWASDIFNYDNSLYELDSSILLPTISTTNTSTETFNAYNALIKNYILQYGGPYVGTYSPDTTCGFNNTDGNRVVKIDDCLNDSSNSSRGHAMQIIGWDDNYQYRYCDDGVRHYNVVNGSCSKGTLKTGVGAWILKNSWGNSTKYPYLTYNSIKLSVGFATSLSEMSNRTWDNNYHHNPWSERDVSNGLIGTNYDENEFTTNNKNGEKIEKIKFFAASRDGTFNISINTKDNNYTNIVTVNVAEAGINTIDLSSHNIIVDDSTFSVSIYGVQESYIFQNSIAVFTSNINSSPSAKNEYSGQIVGYSEDEVDFSHDNPAYVINDNVADPIYINHYTKNISPSSLLQYKVMLGDVDYTNNFFATSPNVFNVNGYVYSVLNPKSRDYGTNSSCGKTFEFKIMYNNTVIQSFPLKRICNISSTQKKFTSSTLTFHMNDGSGFVDSVDVQDLDNYLLMNGDGTGNFNLLDFSQFFKSDQFIASWNTKSDGTGVTYTNNQFLLYHDLDLYAQWSSPHKYLYTYRCLRGDCSVNNENIVPVVGEYNVVQTINNNTFTNISGKAFIHWESNDGIYYPGEEVSDLSIEKSVYNDITNPSRYLNAVWSNDYKTITFNANGGQGVMQTIKVITGVDARIRYSTFTKDGSLFDGWNTKADGSGIHYDDGATININSDTTLYAEWDNDYPKITFMANDGSGESVVQRTDGSSTILRENTFTRDGYTFAGWSTLDDLVHYDDQENIGVLSDDLVLKATWTINKYIVTFIANNGSDESTSQEVSYNVPVRLVANSFVKDGSNFLHWNTEINDNGVVYQNEQLVTLSDNLTLYAIWEEREGYIINGYTRDDVNKYIDSIQVNTTVDDYRSHFVLDVGYTIDVQYKTVNNKNVIYTGSVTKIYKNNVLVVQYKNIIRGDASGDGKINYLDYVNVYNHIQKTKHPESTKKLLVGEFLVAGDMSNDNKINYLDYVRIYNKIKELRNQ